MTFTYRLGLCLAFLLPAGRVWAGADPGQPPCEPGYTIVEEIAYKEVCRYVCRPVPDVKKTTHVVYGCKKEGFCVPGCSLHLPGHCPSGCPGKVKAHTRNLLVKKVVSEETPTTKWVTEMVTEMVPCKVLRKVPPEVSRP
jgi:hypothetical protein